MTTPRTLLPLMILAAMTATWAVGRPPLPTYETRDWSGRSAPLAELGVGATPRAVVNFWATWCPPCRDELPWLLALHDAGRIHLVAVNVGDRPVDVARFLQEAALERLPVRFVDARAFAMLAAPGLPTTFLVDGAAQPVVHLGPLTLDALRSAFPEAPWSDD